MAAKVEVLLCERHPPKKALGGKLAQGSKGKDIKRLQTKETGLQRREGILGRGIKISFEEQQLIASDHPSVHDRFGSTMARPERKER